MHKHRHIQKKPSKSKYLHFHLCWVKNWCLIFYQKEYWNIKENRVSLVRLVKHLQTWAHMVSVYFHRRLSHSVQTTQLQRQKVKHLLQTLTNTEDLHHCCANRSHDTPEREKPRISPTAGPHWSLRNKSYSVLFWAWNLITVVLLTIYSCCSSKRLNVQRFEVENQRQLLSYFIFTRGSVRSGKSTDTLYATVQQCCRGRPVYHYFSTNTLQVVSVHSASSLPSISSSLFRIPEHHFLHRDLHFYMWRRFWVVVNWQSLHW